MLLEGSDKRPNLLWWIPPLMLLWVNLHAGYPIGLAFVAIFLLGEALEAAVRPSFVAPFVASTEGIAPGLHACLALVALNPNGLRIYPYPFETLHSAAMHRFIQEWFSPNFHDPMYMPLLMMLLALLAGLAVSPRRPRLRNLALLLVTILAALRSIRHVPILVLVLVPVLADLAEACLRRRGAGRF